MKRAGDLDKRVFIEIADGETDDVGQEIETWRVLQEVWAGIDPLRGQEQALAAGLKASYDTRITIKWSPYISAITAKWRVRQVFRGQSIIYDVTSVPPIPDHDGLLTLTARSGLTEG